MAGLIFLWLQSQTEEQPPPGRGRLGGILFNRRVPTYYDDDEKLRRQVRERFKRKKPAEPVEAPAEPAPPEVFVPEPWGVFADFMAADAAKRQVEAMRLAMQAAADAAALERRAAAQKLDEDAAIALLLA